MLEQIRKASVTIYILRHPVEAHFGTMKVELAADGQQAITLTTSTGDSLVVGKQHPLSLVAHSGESLPQVIVRNNLPALISRNVYYQLIDWALEAAGSNTDSLFIESMGEQFLLGES